MSPRLAISESQTGQRNPSSLTGPLPRGPCPAGFVLSVVYRVAGSMRSPARVTVAGVRCPKLRTPVQYAKTGDHIL
jgi:hypothetical protein